MKTARTIQDLHVGQNNVRCRIEGAFDGKPFVYEDDPEEERDGWGSQYLFLDKVDGEFVLDGVQGASLYWWTGGSFGCDCNRSEFIGGDVELECNHGENRIKIHRIVPLIENAPPEWTLEIEDE